MRGNDKVISELNRALSAELSAIVQYMVQAEMCDNWGYKKLGAATKKRAIEEMRHAEGLIERILFLEGTPVVAAALQPKIGARPQAQLELDLQDEADAVKQYNAAVDICRQEGDNGSRELFEKLIKDEETHTDYLETQLRLISEVGIQNYLSDQTQGD